MPELPETETIARDLHDAVTGARISHATVMRGDVLREIEEADLDEAVRGMSVLRVWRRAKLVVIDLARNSTLDHRAVNDRNAREKSKPAKAPTRSAQIETQGNSTHAASAHIVVQPRFTGVLLLDDGSLPPDQLAYLTVTFALDDGRSLHYRDVRRLGTLAFMNAERFLEYSGALGPEPLDAEFTEVEFSALVRASRKSIKAVLMDQSRLAGVGNIYANEALWRAGIDPSRVADTLSGVEAAHLLTHLRAVLLASIEARGTSFRDYRDARGQRGGFVSQLAAYGRGGEPCLRCGTKLVDTHAIDGRTTVLCAYCQR